MKQKNIWSSKILLDESLDRENKDSNYIRNVIEKIGRSKECQRIFYLGLFLRIFGHIYNIVIITLFSYMIAMLNYFIENAVGLVIGSAATLLLILPNAYIFFPSYAPDFEYKMRGIWTTRVTRIYLYSRYSKMTDAEIKYLYDKFLWNDRNLRPLYRKYTQLDEPKKLYNFSTLKKMFAWENVLLLLGSLIVFILLIVLVIMCVNR